MPDNRQCSGGFVHAIVPMRMLKANRVIRRLRHGVKEQRTRFVPLMKASDIDRRLTSRSELALYRTCCRLLADRTLVFPRGAFSLSTTAHPHTSFIVYERVLYSDGERHGRRAAGVRESTIRVIARLPPDTATERGNPSPPAVASAAAVSAPIPGPASSPTPTGCGQECGSSGTDRVN